MKANKWEWSEFYVFLKILEDRKLPAANKDLQLLSDKFFIFKKIIRNELGQSTKIFDLENKNLLILDENGNVLKELKESEIIWKTLKIFEKIKKSKKSSFELPEAEKLMEKLMCTKIKAVSSEKSDLDAFIYDRISDSQELLWFSIKSMLGAASTLLNPGKTTNFKFEIKNLDDSLINSINSILWRSKIKDRLAAIFKNWGELTFSKMSSSSFESNLKKIDTAFPSFIAQMLISFFSGKGSKVKDLVRILSEDSLIGELYWLTNEDHEFKVKNFLVSSALGMVPSQKWNWFTKAYWGYIVVKWDGEVICYHLYNRDEFLSYLFENTKFDTASSTRYDYGKIYSEEGRLFINLNLQIRFLK